MRTVQLLAFLLLSSAVASAADTYTQKREVAPSVAPGDAPAPRPVAEAGWQQRFTAGPVPLWIWGADPDKEYFLRKEFAAAGVKTAKLRVTADNHVRLTLNGNAVASNDEWQEPVEVDVTKHLKPEGNVLVAEVRNDGGPSGFVIKLVMTTDEGETKYVVSDETWSASEKKDDTKGVPVKKVAKYGDQPWGTGLDGPAVPGPGAKVPANVFQTLPGYKVEKLFTVPKAELGSWVSMTFDDKGRIIASDQEGKGLCRITPPKIGTNEETKVEHLKVKITAAQGLLYANGSLYLMCNGGPGSGLYRVRDTDGDDQFDEVVKLKA